MSTEVAPPWLAKKTDESRAVEAVLRRAGFAEADAYRFSSASLRVRVTDERFRGVPREERDRMVDPVLATLPPEIEGDIMVLLLFYPGEPDDSFRQSQANREFEYGESEL